MIQNYPSLIAFVTGIVSLSIYMFFLAPKQFNEVLRPKDGITNLRKIILTLLIVTILTSIPPTVYQFYRMTGHEYTFLRNLSTILSQASKLGTTILLVMVYTYRRKDT